MTLSARAQSCVDAAVAGDTAQAAWLRAGHKRGRASIYRALRIDPSDSTAPYAAAPFVIVDYDDQTWIAAAVGCPAVFSTADIEIVDLILWHPPSNAVRVMGEAAKVSMLFMPLTISAELTIFADPFSFFRAWADRRAAFLASYQAAKTNIHTMVPREPRDGNMPGAFVVGDLNKIHLHDTGANTLVAGPGVEPKALTRAVFRSAGIPRVVSAPQMMRAA